MYKVSVVIAFYNKIDYLKLVIAGFERQTFKDFEIIISDDGSDPLIVRELESLMISSPLRICHIWQEDRGFRKNRNLNRSVKICRSDYIIFSDGDCIPHAEFVWDHFSNRKENKFLSGRRVNLSREFTGTLTPDKIRDGYLEKKLPYLILNSITGKTSYAEKSIRIRAGFLRKLLLNKKRGILGSNFSLYKTDLLKINGFDERYESPSIGEDTDVQLRLGFINVTPVDLSHLAIQYHLYHKTLERNPRNQELYAETLENRIFFTPFGIKHPN